MTLKELKNMIAEEFEAFQNEAEDEVDVSVDTDAGDIDAMPEEGEEDVLRKIYDLLAAHFEGGEEDMDMDAEEMPMDDVPGEEEADLEENSTTAAQYQKTGFAAGGAGKGSTGYDGKAGKGGTGYDASSKALQERFQKLANIIK
jgi:hypothetical protein